MKVLVVDDSVDDLLLTRLAFRRRRDLSLVGECHNGEEAIAYLSGEGQFADRQKHPFPDLLLLDIRMPLIDGFEFLAWVKQQHFPGLQVAVYSGSERACDIKKALELGATFYFFKSKGPAALLEGLQAPHKLAVA